MDRKDIIRMARKAGFTEGDIALFPDLIVHFADLVAAAEREACAKLCQEMYWCYDKTEFATAIRARGDKE